jgi:hypothetical protein
MAQIRRRISARVRLSGFVCKGFMGLQTPIWGGWGYGGGKAVWKCNPSL